MNELNSKLLQLKNSLNEFGNTVFHDYANGKLEKFPKKKLFKGALLIRNTMEETPFMVAIKNNANRDIISNLIEGNVVNIPDFWGKYPIYYIKKDIDLIRILVNAGLNFNLEDNEGNNAVDIITKKSESMPELVYANSLILRHMYDNIDRVRNISPGLALMIEREALIFQNTF